MMEARLLADLHNRLADLDHKVRAYRQDLVADFQRYYTDLIRDVAPAAASKIEQDIVSTLPSYLELRPELGAGKTLVSEPDSRSASGSASVSESAPASGLGSTSAFQSPTTVAEFDGTPDSPIVNSREREQELQGLFTPSYLPLLDSWPATPASPTTVRSSSHLASGASAAPAASAMPESRLAQAGQALKMELPSRPAEIQEKPSSSPNSKDPLRPGHERRATDDTTSSTISEKSDSRPPRSAMRRSSSASKPPQSPRRVRFEFMGAEVLPTASPQPSQFITPRPSSPLLSADLDVTASMLSDEEDEEDYQPPPKKISSSEALRALSRTPLEEGTVWTVVNPDEEEIVQQKEDLTPIPTPRRQKTPPSLPAISKTLSVSDPREAVRRLGSVNEESPGHSDEESSEEEFLAMGPKPTANKKTAGQLPSKVPINLAHGSGQNGQSAIMKEPKTSPSSQHDVDVESEDNEDDEDLFEFEASGLSAPPRQKGISIPAPIQDRESDEDELHIETDVPESRRAALGTSPAIPISSSRGTGSAGPSTPTTAKFQPGSLGSYKGRPVEMPIVKDPEVHARAESLGQLSTFVGSVDGRTGLDEGDYNSFRASMASLSGTPRSFSERLMMEEAKERGWVNEEAPQ